MAQLLSERSRPEPLLSQTSTHMGFLLSQCFPTVRGGQQTEPQTCVLAQQAPPRRV
jgi:hypothetical protein